MRLNHLIDHEKHVKNIGTSKQSQFQVSVLGILLFLLITLNVSERIEKLRRCPQATVISCAFINEFPYVAISKSLITI